MTNMKAAIVCRENQLQKQVFCWKIEQQQNVSEFWQKNFFALSIINNKQWIITRRGEGEGAEHWATTYVQKV